MPGDKSISHRAAILGAMSDGEVLIKNFSESADCASTLSCLQQLGVSVEKNGRSVSVSGVGKRGFETPSEPLNCGNSGTTMRLLAGLLAGQNFDSVLIGDESLSERPMERIAFPLNKMGAKIATSGGKPPIRIEGNCDLRGIEYQMPVASAQLKSAILLAGLNADGNTIVIDPTTPNQNWSPRNHTELMLSHFGADIDYKFAEEHGEFTCETVLESNSVLEPNDFDVPGDISSAAFFVVAACALEGSETTMANVGINPTRMAFLEYLKDGGANISIKNEKERNSELFGDLEVRFSPNLINSADLLVFEGGLIAGVIDEIPILAVLGTQIEGGLKIKDAAELRVKESDRIKSVVYNLRRMNANVTEFEDGLAVAKSTLKGARVGSFGDHRIAMAFAIAGLFAEGETEIIDADCANVSFPDFFVQLANVVK